MSALLGNAKLARALAAAYRKRAAAVTEGHPDQLVPRADMAVLLTEMAIAHELAAELIEEQGRRDASGPAFEDRPQPLRRKP